MWIKILTLSLVLTSPLSAIAGMDSGWSREITPKKNYDCENTCSPIVSAISLPEDHSAFKRPSIKDNISDFSQAAHITCESARTVNAPLIQIPDIKKPTVLALYDTHGFNWTVRENLQYFSRFKRSFSKRLKRSGRYVDMMSEIITREGLPQELAYLPLIESEFRTDAYSHKHASGPWQFMTPTARRLGLKVDWWVDERRDPVKSTQAAAKYLKYLFNKFGSWNLALAAYNTGESRIRRAISKAGTDDFWALRRTRHISWETRNYVPSYIAATAIAMAPEAFGITDITYEKPFDYVEISIKHPMSVDTIARFSGVKEQLIRELNPELRRWCTPPDVDQYKLRIPRHAKKMFVANIEKTRGMEYKYIRFYAVRHGDTVAKIADRLGASIQRIINMNDLGGQAVIFAGKQIVVPTDKNYRL
jgi:membrane-bound lytic murein transglycosylase D